MPKFDNWLVIQNIIVPISRGGKSTTKTIVDTAHLKKEQERKLKQDFPGARVEVHIHVKKWRDTKTRRISTKLFSMLHKTASTGLEITAQI